MAEKSSFFPFNYQYQVSSAIYDLIQKSSKEYSKFLHDKGYKLIDEVTSGNNEKLQTVHLIKTYKLFTFSKLQFFPYQTFRNGFRNVREIQFVFSTPVQDTYKHFVYGIFSDQTIRFNFIGQDCYFVVTNVEALPEPIFSKEVSFISLSPICVSTVRLNKTGEKEQHFLDYLQPEERIKFEENIQKNLIRKYKTLSGETINLSKDFEFTFDPDYVIHRQGQISKLIHFKDNIKIKAFEAPFIIKADPRLINIGYTCGFGEKNSAGFGCAEVN